MPRGAHVLHHWRNVPGMPVGVARNGRPERRTALPSPPERSGLGVAQPHTPRLLATASASLVRFDIASRSACATSDSNNPNREVVRLRQVHRGEPDAAVGS